MATKKGDVMSVVFSDGSVLIGSIPGLLQYENINTHAHLDSEPNK